MQEVAYEVGYLTTLDTNYALPFGAGEAPDNKCVHVFLYHAGNRLVGFVMIQRRWVIWRATWQNLDMPFKVEEIKDAPPMWSVGLLWVHRGARNKGTGVVSLIKRYRGSECIGLTSPGKLRFRETERHSFVCFIRSFISSPNEPVRLRKAELLATFLKLGFDSRPQILFPLFRDEREQFLGALLGVSDLLWRHLSLESVTELCRLFRCLGCHVKSRIRFRVIFLNAVAEIIALAKTELTQGIALLGCLAIPLHGFRIILLCAFPFV